jgi:predicted negative regulator of RcsB-dependent stress response
MKQNFLYLIIGAVSVAVVILGYQFYQDRQKTSGVEINIDDSGISIQKKILPVAQARISKQIIQHDKI